MMLTTAWEPCWTTLHVFNNYVEITGLNLNGCNVYTARIRARCSECWNGSSNYSPLYYFPECMPEGIHIGTKPANLRPLHEQLLCVHRRWPGPKNQYPGSRFGFLVQHYLVSAAWLSHTRTQLINRECINMGLLMKVLLSLP